jgi:hypothetical protein
MYSPSSNRCQAVTSPTTRLTGCLGQVGLTSSHGSAAQAVQGSRWLGNINNHNHSLLPQNVRFQLHNLFLYRWLQTREEQFAINIF